MIPIARTVLAAIALAGPVLAVAASQPANAGSKPSSYAPRPQTQGHVYGSPIEPPITGRAAASHHTYGHEHKKEPSNGAAHHAHQAPAHPGRAKARSQAPGSPPSPR